MRVGNFVAEIVGPAAIRVDVVKMLMKFLREQPGDDVEIFVVMRGQPARVMLRLFGRAAGDAARASRFRVRRGATSEKQIPRLHSE